MEVVGIEPTSKSTSNREHYVCSRIRASDGCEYLVKYTNLGELLARLPDSLVEFSFPTFPQRSLPTFCYRCRPLITSDNSLIMQRKLILLRFRVNLDGFLLGLPTNLDTHSILQYPCRNQCTPRSVEFQEFKVPQK